MHQRWDTTFRGIFKISDKLVFLRVQRHDGRHAIGAGRIEDWSDLIVDEVRVGPEHHEIVALLDGCESGAGHDNGRGALEAFNGGAHGGGLQLDNLLGIVVLGVDSLLFLIMGRGTKPPNLSMISFNLSRQIQRLFVLK